MGEGTKALGRAGRRCGVRCRPPAWGVSADVSALARRCSGNNTVQNKVILGWLVICSVAVYWRTVSYDFVEYDDGEYVYQNAHLQGKSMAREFAWALTRTHSANWHPVTWISHILDYRFSHLDPGCHHLTNVMLHVANTLLIYLLFKGMTGRLWPSAFLAALFAVHPLHVESVAWISERKDVLSTLFGLLSLWAYAAFAVRGGRDQYLLCLLFLGMGLMAKPMLVSWPLLFLLLDYWPLRRMRWDRPRLWCGGGDDATREAGTPSYSEKTPGALLKEKVPMVLLCALVCVITYVAQMPGIDRKGVVPLLARLANAVHSYAWYVVKTLWPSHLCALYLHPYIPGGKPLSPWAVAGALLLLIALSLGVIRRRHDRYLLVGWLWFLVTLVPVIGLVRVGMQARADRYMYIPSIGLFLMLVWSLETIVSNLPGRRVLAQRVLLCGGVILTTIYLVMASRQVTCWRNSETLFRRAVYVDPANVVMLNNMSFVLGESGRWHEALTFAERAIVASQQRASSPKDGYLNRGVAYAHLGETEKARQDYLTVLNAAPRDLLARRNLILVLQDTGRIDEAIDQCQQAVRIAPRNHQLLGQLVWLLATHPQPTEDSRRQALAYAEQLKKICNCVSCQAMQAAAYAAVGQFDRATRMLASILAKARELPPEPWREEFIKHVSESLEHYRAGKL